LTGVGTVVLEASRAGNAIFNAAPAVDLSIAVNPLPPATPGALDPTFGYGGKLTIDFTDLREYFRENWPGSHFPYIFQDRPTSVAVQPDGTIFVAGTYDQAETPSGIATLLSPGGEVIW